jgi:hypothetical protein
VTSSSLAKALPLMLSRTHAGTTSPGRCCCTVDYRVLRMVPLTSDPRAFSLLNSLNHIAREQKPKNLAEAGQKCGYREALSQHAP